MKLKISVIIPILISLFLTTTLAKIANATTDNISIVEHSAGSFVNHQNKKWVEKNLKGEITFHFIEQSKTKSTILLLDESRNLHISIIIPSNDIYFSHQGNSFQKLYTITNVQYSAAPSLPEPLNCGENYELVNGDCVLVQNCGANATRNVESDCFCDKNYELKKGVCRWKTDKNGFEIAPWEKPECKELDRLCKRDIHKACTQYEEICQVN